MIVPLSCQYAAKLDGGQDAISFAGKMVRGSATLVNRGEFGEPEAMIDFEAQRLAMIESQLRPNEVREPRLLEAIRAIPRERFVPPRVRPLSYMDGAIEVFPSIDGAPARYLLEPVVSARLIQLASVEPDDTVLDVGCATGYSTAILARLGRKVIGLEPEPELAEVARESLQQLAVENAEIVQAPLAQGYAAGGPYDAIVLNGAVPQIPEPLKAQLKEGGRLVAILSPATNGSLGRAHLFVKVHGKASGLPHFDAGAERLPGFSWATSFSL